MIPLPRPGLRFGDCPECGRPHLGECMLPMTVDDYVMPGFNRQFFLELLGAGLLPRPEAGRTATEHFRRIDEEEARLRAKMERIRWRSIPSD